MLSDDEYVEQCACPQCGTTTGVTYGDPEVAEVALITRHARCESCGFTWVEFYRLTGYDAA